MRQKHIQYRSNFRVKRRLAAEDADDDNHAAAVRLDLADEVVEIPMAGTKQSLNVAVSFGVLAYAIRRSWLQQLAAGGGA